MLVKRTQDGHHVYRYVCILYMCVWKNINQYLSNYDSYWWCINTTNGIHRQTIRYPTGIYIFSIGSNWIEHGKWLSKYYGLYITPKLISMHDMKNTYFLVEADNPRDLIVNIRLVRLWWIAVFIDPCAIFFRKFRLLLAKLQ